MEQQGRIGESPGLETAPASGLSWRRHFNARFAGLALFLVFLTLLAYIPALRCGYIWDDDVYVTRNSLLTAHDGLSRIWFSAHGHSQYFPLVFTTLRVEHMLWGLNPLGYHLVNVLLHAVNALLIWAVLRRLALPGAWLAAAIWALHPVNVESVAWITELKNTESTLFYLLALLAWMKFTAGETVHSWRFYVLSLLLYVLALCAKTTACTLPAAMLLVLWLGKEPIRTRRWIQVAPFFILGFGMGLLSVWWEGHLGNYSRGGVLLPAGVLGRVLIATRALWFYAAKLVWPTRLAFSYARWEINPSDPRQYVWVVGCVTVALLLCWKRNIWGRSPFAAVVFFVAALSPMLGFVPLYTFRYSFVADHYQYLASIGIIALAVATMARVQWQRRTRVAVGGAILTVLGVLSWQRCCAYRDEETLWRDTIAKNPGSWMAHENLGVLLQEAGKVTEAINHYQEALRVKPDDATAHNDWGNALVLVGSNPEATQHYEQALRFEPDWGDVQNNWGNALLLAGDVRGAMEHYQLALRLNPGSAESHYNLGRAFQQMGKLDDASKQYEQALLSRIDFAEAHNNLGDVLRQTGKIQEAIVQYEQALQSQPVYAEAHYNLGIALTQVGKLPEATAQYEEALKINPAYAAAHNNLGNLLLQERRIEDAIGHFEQALRIDPNYVAAHNNLGNALVQAGRLE